MTLAPDQQLKRRLGIGHIILWISCCAIFFAISKHAESDRWVAPIGILLLSLIASIYGTCWAICLIVIYRCVRFSRPQIQPGEWLLFCLGLIFTAEVLTEQLPKNSILSGAALQLAIACGALVIPTLSRQLAMRWRLLFIGFVVAYAGPLCLILADSSGFFPGLNLAQWSTTLIPVRPILLAIMLSAVVLRDAQQKQPYGWSHWLGIACTACWIASKWL
ncbi:MAG: hypothetical protein GY768_23025 [Planctomycetaceae bacterium]|nr:hypothetical protein [Planctomycetaceae bacterium]